MDVLFIILVSVLIVFCAIVVIKAHKEISRIDDFAYHDYLEATKRHDNGEMDDASYAWLLDVYRETGFWNMIIRKERRNKRRMR